MGFSATFAGVSEGGRLQRDACQVPFRLSRFVPAVLLGIAALLKLNWLTFDPSALLLSQSQTFYEIVHIQLEVFLAIWLVGGFLQRESRRTAIIAFSVYCLAALYRYLTGADSCGCFGAVIVNPLIVALGDFAILVLLRLSVVELTYCNDNRLLCVPLAAALLTGIASSMVIGSPTNDLSGFSDRGSSVLLTPDNWKGKPFPLIPVLAKSASLRTGHWTVILVRASCAACHHAVNQAFAGSAGRKRVCVVELPPYSSDSPWPPEVLRARLKTPKKLVVATPVVIHLVEGMVVSIGRPAGSDLVSSDSPE